MAKCFYSRLKGFIKYGFYIVSVILMVINAIFFFWHWNSLTINLDASSMFLTFVGFLFAFAGINIYSIFNTNIENEKYELRLLKDRYDKMLELSAKELIFPKDLMTAHLLSNYISNSKSYSINSIDWIDGLSTTLHSLKLFTADLKKNHKLDAFERCRMDLNQASANIYNDLRLHKESISDQFFKDQGQKDKYMDRLGKAIELASWLRTYEFDEENTDVPKRSFIEKLKSIFIYSKSVFKSTSSC